MKKKSIRLNTMPHVKRFMQKVINDYSNGLIDDNKAKTLATLTNTYLKILEVKKYIDTPTHYDRNNIMIMNLDHIPITDEQKRLSVEILKTLTPLSSKTADDDLLNQ